MLEKKYKLIKTEHMTEKDFLDFIQAVKDDAQETDNWDYYIFFNLSYFTGLRPKEILSLKWNDFENNKIKINPAILKNPKEDVLRLCIKKIGDNYYIDLSEELINMINEHLMRSKSKNTFFSDNYICGDNNKLNKKEINKMKNIYTAAAEINEISLYDFRNHYLVENLLK